MSAIDPLERTAFHEAGHAVVALWHGRPVGQVSILPDHTRLGYCEIRKGQFGPRHDPLEVNMLILLAGVASEARRAGGDHAWEGAAQDLNDVRKLSLLRAPNDRQAERLERRMLSKVEKLLGHPAVWQAVEEVARQLLEQTTLSGRAARHLFEQARARHQDA
ncbi:MAG: cell division protein FtsH [Planctomycetaceae bacterium]